MKKVSRAELGRYALEDLRILPVVSDAQGTRRRDFNEAVSAMKDGVPQGGGLQLEGPTSSLNLVKGMRQHTMSTGFGLQRFPVVIVAPMSMSV